MKILRKTLANDENSEETDCRSLLIGRIGVALALIAGVIIAWNPPEFLAVLLWVGGDRIGVSWSDPDREPLAPGDEGRRDPFFPGRRRLLCPDLPGLYARYPFGSTGYSVIIASVVMLIVTPLTKPMPPEFVAKVFGDRSPEREPAPTYASTAMEDAEPEGGATS